MAKRKPKRKPALNRVEKLLRSDGALSVTFVNTAQRKPLASYEDLLAWSVEFGALSPESARRLDALAAEHPGAAAGAFRKGRTLRDRLERIFGALAVAADPAGDDFKPFNAELRRVMGARELDPSGRRWCWGETEDEDLDRMLWPVLYSAAYLLTSKYRGRVRQCALEGCELFFVVRNAGRPRKWCSIACGNRHTSRTHYRRSIRPRREGIQKEKRGRQRARLAGYDDEAED